MEELVIEGINYSIGIGPLLELFAFEIKKLDAQRMDSLYKAIGNCKENDFVVISITTEAFGKPDWYAGVNKSNRLAPPTQRGTFKSLSELTDEEFRNLLSRIFF